MSEFSLSPTAPTKKAHLTSLLLSAFLLLCAFILYHPLYFSYFIFFSPCLIKILSFLSPLFLTTSLLLLALLSSLYPSLVHDSSQPEFSETKQSFLLAAFRNVAGTFRSKFEDKDEEFLSLEEFEAYKMVFEGCLPEIGENPIDIFESESGETCLASQEAFVDKFCSHESSVAEVPLPKNDEPVAEEPKTWEKEEKEVKRLTVVSEKVEGQKTEMSTRRGSKARGNTKITQTKVVCSDDDDDNAKLLTNTAKAEKDLPYPSSFLGKISVTGGEKAAVSNPKLNGEPNLGSSGSMRREKEWRRTLACKLFEERHNVVDASSSEGMDLLWETYETETDNIPRRTEKKVRKKIKERKKSIQELYRNDDDDDAGEDEDEGSDDGQLCCLQALKFSAGKMHLGMARPNLVKISKAIKGIGWLHHVTNKHSKNR